MDMIKFESKPVRQYEWRDYQKGSLTENGLALNETAAFIWGCCDGKTSVGEIVKKLVDEYEVDEKTAKSDTFDCLDLFLAEFAIKINK